MVASRHRTPIETYETYSDLEDISVIRECHRLRKRRNSGVSREGLPIFGE